MGKVTLVTGGTSGIGKATSFLLAGKGYEVYAGARNPADGETLVAEAETFVPMAKQLTDEAFEARVKRIFGL
jgi:NAD(P)-dependent dehydrogenase (short-subunit alcohol dehydrogenase family)